ncbi:MAG: tetratricopeptide repeat protein [Treponema sp.]|nr:tetratricopeptide repeat protein [Treponema sp.]
METAQALTVYTAKVRNNDPVLAGITAPLGNRKALAVNEAVLEHLNIGKDYLAAGVYDAAIEEFNKALAKNRNFVEALFYRGEAYRSKSWEANNYTQTIADYTRALELDPNYAAAWLARASMYSFGDDKAIADYTRYIRLKPDDPGGYFERGRRYLYNKQNDRAIADFAFVIRLDPNNAGAYFLRAGLHGATRDWDAAVADLTQGFTLDSSQSYYFDGVAVGVRLEILTRYIGLHPDSAGAYARRGWVHMDDSRKDYDQAIADFTQAIRLEPNNSYRYEDRANAYEKKGDYDQAIADYTQVIRLAPDRAPYWERANAYANKGDYDRAIADYTQAIRLDPNDATAYNNRGSAYGTKGMYDRAIADFEAALRVNPNHTNARKNLEAARRARGR